MNTKVEEKQPLQQPPGEEKQPLQQPAEQPAGEEKQPLQQPAEQSAGEEKQPLQQPAGEEKQPLQQPAGESSPSEKWGTKYMGPPAPPSAHPLNQQAATWTAWDEQHPYVLGHTEGEKPRNSPLESVLHTFNEWGKKAETMTSNIWHNLKTGPSVSEAAWGKLSLTAKAITEGGFESLYKQTFPSEPVEKLKKTFACYLSTSTGPVAGTLYLSNVNIAFCSDRPLTFTAPSGQQAWFHYKVLVPLARIDSINPVIMKENPSEKYIQIVTIDGHDFWFMGFVNYEKARTHLSGALSDFVASIKRTEPPPVYDP